MKTNDQLRKDVMDELKWDPQVKDFHTQIGVSVKEGVVTLSGTVFSYDKKLAAERAAQRVKGVKVLASDIEVNLSTSGTKTDTEIAEAIKNALVWNNSVNEDKIEVKVDNGWVFLDGEANWKYQKASVQYSIENLTGVRGVTNNIKLKADSIDIKEMKSKINEAFHRNATLDANAITIETEKNRVTLSGTVKSLIEKEEAEKIAWASPGVLNVVNQIQVVTSDELVF